MKAHHCSLLLLLFFPLFCSSSVKAQSEESEELSKRARRKSRPAYINFSFGGQATAFRDFATSPHVYSGLNTHLGLAYSRADKERTTSLGFNYSFGQASMSFNDHFAGGSINTISIFHERLYQIKALSNERWNVKAGGMIDFMMNFRENSFLLNNSLGIEFFPSLMGVGEVGLDVSRKQTKHLKFLFLKFRLRPRQRHLSFRTNIGIVNTTYRNGYVYSTGESAVLNDIDSFEGYEWRFFSGVRLGSALDYTLGLRNGNFLRFSYLWNVYTTGGELDKLEMVTHTARVSFLFNIKSAKAK